MNILRQILWIAGISTLSACGELPVSSGSSTPSASEPGASDDIRESIGSDSTGRFSYYNSSISLKKEASSAVESGFIYVASMDAPVDEELEAKLQATSFVLDKDEAVVSYNMAGPDLSGAVELLSLKDPSKPGLLHSLMTPDLEFADMARYKDFVYAVGASIDGGVLVVYEVGKNALREVSRYSLDGYYANAVSIKSKDLYVSVGDNLGVLHFDIAEPSKPSLLKSHQLLSSTYVLPWNRGFLAFGEGALFYSDRGDDLEGLIKLSRNDFEAPARFKMDKNIFVTNAVGNELQVYDLKKDQKLLSSTSLKGRGNSLDVYKNSLFLAQGEAGVQYFDVSDWENPQYKGAFDFKDDRGSANNVKVKKIKSGEFVFSADGLGGLRILRWGKVSRKPQVPERLSASKTYNPSQWMDGIIDLEGQQTDFVVPNSISVVEGNAGNHRVELHFDDIVCSFQGGSSQAHPKGEKQISLGLFYHLKSCSDSSGAGDVVLAQDRVKLSVSNGDSYLEVTEVEWDVELDD